MLVVIGEADGSPPSDVFGSILEVPPESTKDRVFMLYLSIDRSNFNRYSMFRGAYV